MQENAISYNEILNYFGEQKISGRFKFLYDRMTEYIKIRGMEEKMFVHEAILQQMVMDYFVDIYRLKEFHKVDKANMMKILAYEAYWIIRRKPLQMKPEASDMKMIFANEGFVTTFLAHEFLLPIEGEPMTPAEEEQFLAYLQHIHYHLKYRNLDKQDMEAMLYSYYAGRVIAKNNNK